MAGIIVLPAGAGAAPIVINGVAAVNGEVTLTSDDFDDTSTTKKFLTPSTATAMNIPTTSSITAMLTNYYTEAEIATILLGYPTNAELTAILANYYTETEVNALLAAFPSGGLSDAKIKTRSFLRC